EADLRILNHQLGCTHPNENMFASLGSRALTAALQFSPLRVGEFLAPRERRSFTELVDGWALTIARWAEARLPNREASTFGELAAKSGSGGITLAETLEVAPCAPVCEAV